MEYLTTAFGFVQRLEQTGGPGATARAKVTGADVTDLEMAPSGDRRFTATDPEGQVRVFAQRIEGR